MLCCNEKAANIKEFHNDIKMFYIVGWYFPPENSGCTGSVYEREKLTECMPKLFMKLDADVLVVGDPNAIIVDFVDSKIIVGDDLDDDIQELDARTDNEDQGHNYNGGILESWLSCADVCPPVNRMDDESWMS